MRFGTFHLPLSPDPALDWQLIEDQMLQIEAAERLGFTTAWLTEHNFTGECVWGDPIPVAAALSSRTSTIRIGFAVLQMSIHHPTRMALQMAVLDNLLRGRLTVGIGRGSAYNEYEYVAFGLRSDGGREKMFEAVDLIQRAFTEAPLEFHGKHFDVTIPSIRPTPVQRPHPPIMLSVLGDDTLRHAAAKGFPVMFPRLELDRFRERIEFFTRELRAAGHSIDATERVLDRVTLQRSIYVGETTRSAMADIHEPTLAVHHLVQSARTEFNPKDVDSRERALFRWNDPTTPPDEAVAELISRGFIAGSADHVGEQVAELEKAGVRNVMCGMSWGGIAHGLAIASMERFARHVMPTFSREAALA